MSNKREPNEREVVGFIGVGMDNKDGHQRLTRSEYFVLLGGSEETHGRMQDTAIRFTEALHRKGKRLPDATEEEVDELLRDAQKE